VCRLENGGQEVIAEGIVAWCQKETRGGEFGVRFTALDARSADVLKELCGLGGSEQSAPDAALAPAEPALQAVAKGAKVKLHIEGLGSPMRARVADGDGQRIAVGSTLEFLRLGRKLEMESLDDGSRREARIDGLDVSIDPATGVPRLMVLLKTDSQETTPQPSVVDTAKRAAATKTVPQKTSGATAANAEPRMARESLEAPAGKRASHSQEAIDEQVELMVGRMRRIAGSARRKVTEVSGELGSRIAPTMGRAVQSMRRMSQRGQEPARRRTAPPPAQAPNAAERKLRPQNGAARSSQPELGNAKVLFPPKYKRVAGAVVALGLLATVIAVAARSPEPSTATAESQPGTNLAVLAQPQAGAALPAAGAQAPAVAANGSTQNGLVAQVPLFGPTPMATLEPAPLPAPAAESPEVVAARELALAKASQAAAASGTDTLSEEPAADGSEEEPSTKPEDVPPWGKGRMKDPILYRIKLDEAGSALKGSTQSKGFSVIIPGRKAMESPKGFVSRDPRFAKISAQNTSGGVKLTWTFKDEVPAYRVRLRKTNVEVLISEAVKSGKAN
jgi:hypothetical protein